MKEYFFCTLQLTIVTRSVIVFFCGNHRIDGINVISEENYNFQFFYSYVVTYKNCSPFELNPKSISVT